MVGQHLCDCLAPAPQRVVDADGVDVVLEAGNSILVVIRRKNEDVGLSSAHEGVSASLVVHRVCTSRSLEIVVAVAAIQAFVAGATRQKVVLGRAIPKLHWIGRPLPTSSASLPSGKRVAKLFDTPREVGAEGATRGGRPHRRGAPPVEGGRA